MAETTLHDTSPAEARAAGMAPVTRAERRGLAALLAVALVVRLAAIFVFGAYRVPAKGDSYLFGGEYGRIARSLAIGKGYAMSYKLGHESVSAKGAPLYPLYLAGLFRVFGVFSNQSAFALLVTNSVASTLTALLAFVIGRKLIGPRVGWVAAVLVCFDPGGIWYSSNCFWETAISCFVLTCVLFAMLWLRDRPTAARGAAAGALAAVAAHVNVATLPVAAGLGLWLLADATGRRRAALVGLVAAAAVGGALLVPWSVRSSRVLGEPVLMRLPLPSRFTTWHALQPSDVQDQTLIDQHKLYDQLGEREWLAQLRRFGAERPVPLSGKLRAMGRRTVVFWVGNVWARKSWGGVHGFFRDARLLRTCIHAAVTVLAVAGAVVGWRRGWDVWPLVVMSGAYYGLYAFTHCTKMRYRFPIQGALLLLAAVALVGAYETVTRRRAGGADRADGPAPTGGHTGC